LNQIISILSKDDLNIRRFVNNRNDNLPPNECESHTWGYLPLIITGEAVAVKAETHDDTIGCDTSLRQAAATNPLV